MKFTEENIMSFIPNGTFGAKKLAVFKSGNFVGSGRIEFYDTKLSMDISKPSLAIRMSVDGIETDIRKYISSDYTFYPAEEITEPKKEIVI